MQYAEDGNIYDAAIKAGVEPGELLDFSSNIYPAGLPEEVGNAVSSGLGATVHYPDPEARPLREKAAARFGVDPERLLVGNGSTEFLFAIPRCLRPKRVLTIAPCYHDYWRAIEHAGGEVSGMIAGESDEFVPDLVAFEQQFSGVDMAIVGNPNNPTGVALPSGALRRIAERFPKATILVDEAYAEFVPDAAGATMLSEPLPGNVIVLRSLSAFYGCPGLRLGFMIADARTCNRVQRIREAWSVSQLSLAAGLALVEHPPASSGIRGAVIGERERVRDELSRLAGLRVFRSQANFLLIKITRPTLTAVTLCDRLLEQSVLVRNVAGFRGLDGKFIRVAVRTAEDNDKLLAAMTAALDEDRWK